MLIEYAGGLTVNSVFTDYYDTNVQDAGLRASILEMSSFLSKLALESFDGIFAPMGVTKDDFGFINY